MHGSSSVWIANRTIIKPVNWWFPDVCNRGREMSKANAFIPDGLEQSKLYFMSRCLSMHKSTQACTRANVALQYTKHVWRELRMNWTNDKLWNRFTLTCVQVHPSNRSRRINGFIFWIPHWPHPLRFKSYRLQEHPTLLQKWSLFTFRKRKKRGISEDSIMTSKWK